MGDIVDLGPVVKVRKSLLSCIPNGHLVDQAVLESLLDLEDIFNTLLTPSEKLSNLVNRRFSNCQGV